MNDGNSQHAEPAMFRYFQRINAKRCVDKFHPLRSERWGVARWALAIAGEAGELCDLVKKNECGDFTLGDKRQEVLSEIADLITYCDLLNSALEADKVRRGIETMLTCLLRMRRAAESAAAILILAENRSRTDTHRPSSRDQTRRQEQRITHRVRSTQQWIAFTEIDDGHHRRHRQDGDEDEPGCRARRSIQTSAQDQCPQHAHRQQRRTAQ